MGYPVGPQGGNPDKVLRGVPWGYPGVYLLGPVYSLRIGSRSVFDTDSKSAVRSDGFQFRNAVLQVFGLPNLENSAVSTLPNMIRKVPVHRRRHSPFLGSRGIRTLRLLVLKVPVHPPWTAGQALRCRPLRVT